MTTIKSSTTTTTAYQVVADTTGALVIQTGATPTTAVTVGTDQSVTLAGALTVNGNTTLGDASTDTILMTGAPSIGGAGLGMGMGFRNRLINGGMVIDQRFAGTSVTPANGVVTYDVDRWAGFGNQTAKFSLQQSTTAPTGFTNSLVATSLSAYPVISTDVFIVQQSIEGYNIADLGWGTANAQTITVSFWVRSSLTGTFGGAVTGFSNALSYTFAYTISAANTWEQKTVTITGPTTTTWDKTNGGGLVLRFSLGTGTAGCTAAGSWTTGFYFSVPSAVSVVGTNAANLYITGVQLEKGSTATSFDYRPYGTELALCQRYAFKRLADGSVDNYAPFGMGRYYTTNNVQLYVPFPVTMRTSPSSITVSGTIFANDAGFGGADITGVVLNETSCDGATITGGTTSVGVAGNATTFYASNTSVASILFSAEL